MDGVTITEIVRAVVGGFLVLYVPGYFLSFVFLPGGKVDVIERTAISFALSVAVVPLVAFYLNLLGVKISALSVFLEVLGIVACSVAYLYYKNIYRRNRALKREPRMAHVRHGHVIRLSRRDPPLTILHETLRALTSEEEPKRRQEVAQSRWFLVSREVFQVALLTYMLLVVVDTVRPGVVSNFFEMNYLLVAVLVFGVAMVLAERSVDEDTREDAVA